MDIDLAPAKRRVRHGLRSADHALDSVHEASRRGLKEVRHAADEVIDASERAARSGSHAAEIAYGRISESPLLAVTVAFAAGLFLGAILAPRR